MDNDFEVIKDPKLEEYRQQTLAAGAAFNEMIQSNGWKYVTAVVDSTIKAFTTKALTQGFKDMETFNYERGKVEGQRLILSEVQSAIKELKEENARGAAGTATI
jgi:hypothetical protein